MTVNILGGVYMEKKHPGKVRASVKQDLTLKELYWKIKICLYKMLDAAMKVTCDQKWK